jgi:hypothetical protein
MSLFIENELERDIIRRKPNDYLYAQRTLKHKIKIFYDEMKNLFIENSSTGIFLDYQKFNNNEFEEFGLTNNNNATNLSQVFCETTYDRNITHDNYFFLDGNATFERPNLDPDAPPNAGLKLMGRDFLGETVNTVGWMSRTFCDEHGNFSNPVRLVHEFKSDHSIAQWMIRSVANEVPVDFSITVYNKEKEMIFKKFYKDNKDSTVSIEINRGLCRYIELRIMKWGLKHPTRIGELRFRRTGAKIVYFYHDALFPKGITDYKSNDLLQSFSMNEYLSSSLGKANYGVQSNTGQFTLINIRKLFDTLRFTGFMKSGLKVQYYVSADNYFEPHLDANDNVDEARNKREGIEPPELLNKGTVTSIGRPGAEVEVKNEVTALSLAADNGEWTLLGTQYITDIEFDEVKGIVRFRTQDRMINFKEITYPGYKKVVSGELAPIKNTDLIDDIMNSAELSEFCSDDINRKTELQLQEEFSYDSKPGNVTDNSGLYKITASAEQAMKRRRLPQGYLDEMNVWAALQRACDMDLIHTYVDREDLLIIDKIDQL